MALVTIDGHEVDRPAWLEERRRGIGASETPVVLGLTGSRVKLWLAKTAQLEPEESNEAMEWGLRLEDDIVDAYQARTGRRIAATQQFHAHPDHPRMTATLDGITGCRRVVEFKSVGLYGPGRDLGDDGDSESLPDSWVVQTNQQLAIAGALGIADPDEADVAVFGPGLRLRVYPVRRSDPLIAMAAEAIEAFWRDHVESGIPPEELTAEDAEHVARAFRGETGEMIDRSADADFRDLVEGYARLGETIREAQRDRDRMKAEILMAVGDGAGVLLTGGWEVRRKVVAVKEHLVKASTQVRLTVKEPKS